MKNFNFAFFLALYIIINGSVYIKTPDRNILFISIIVTLPLLFLSLNSLRARPDNKINSKADTFDLLQESLTPYLTALVSASVFIVYVYRFVNENTRQAVFFIAPRIQGWGWQDGLVIGVIALLLGACGVGIWSAQFRQKHLSSEFLKKTASYHIFHIGLSPGIRLFVYFIGMVILTALGLIIVYSLFGKTSIRNNDWRGYIIVSGRAMLPIVILLMGGLLRIPMIALALLAMAGVGYLFGLNTSYIEGAVFAGSQTLIAGIYAVVMSRRTVKSTQPSLELQSSMASDSQHDVEISENIGIEGSDSVEIPGDNQN